MDVNIAEAKTDLSRLIRMVESGREETIWICRYNKRVAKIVSCKEPPVSKRIGVAKGKLKSPKDLDMDNARIEELFGGDL